MNAELPEALFNDLWRCGYVRDGSSTAASGTTGCSSPVFSSVTAAAPSSRWGFGDERLLLSFFVGANRVHAIGVC